MHTSKPCEHVQSFGLKSKRKHPACFLSIPSCSSSGSAATECCTECLLIALPLLPLLHGSSLALPPPQSWSQTWLSTCQEPFRSMFWLCPRAWWNVHRPLPQQQVRSALNSILLDTARKTDSRSPEHEVLDKMVLMLWGWKLPFSVSESQLSSS